MKAKFKVSNLEQFIKEVKELAKKYKLDIEGVGILNRDFMSIDCYKNYKLWGRNA